MKKFIAIVLVSFLSSQAFAGVGQGNSLDKAKIVADASLRTGLRGLQKGVKFVGYSIPYAVGIAGAAAVAVAMADPTPANLMTAYLFPSSSPSDFTGEHSSKKGKSWTPPVTGAFHAACESDGSYKNYLETLRRNDEAGGVHYVKAATSVSAR